MDLSSVLVVTQIFLPTRHHHQWFHHLFFLPYRKYVYTPNCVNRWGVPLWLPRREKDKIQKEEIRAGTGGTHTVKYPIFVGSFDTWWISDIKECSEMMANLVVVGEHNHCTAPISVKTTQEYFIWRYYTIKRLSSILLKCNIIPSLVIY